MYENDVVTVEFDDWWLHRLLENLATMSHERTEKRL